MTSLRQIEANSRNAIGSTGPVTEEGKQRSRRNAVRHGLTSETVIGTLEDAEDYRAFETAVASGFSPETATERELVLRLASLLWRLRRTTAIETGLFEMSKEAATGGDQSTDPSPEDAVVRLSAFRRPSTASPSGIDSLQDQTQRERRSEDPEIRERASSEIDMTSLAGRFLRLAALDNEAFERLGRYETALWRQACQIIFMLDVLRRQNLDTKWLPRRLHSGSRSRFGLPRPIFSGR